MRNEPVAPKNPEKARSRIYLRIDEVFEGSTKFDRELSDLYIIGPNIKERILFLNPNLPEEIIDLLLEEGKFSTLVHSICVTAKADSISNCKEEITINFQKGDPWLHQPIELYHLSVICNGEETKWYVDKEKDTSMFLFISTKLPSVFSGKMTVWLELNYGYEVPEVCLDEPVEFESEQYRAMIQKSLLHLGNPYRLKKAIEKARRGEDVTIAVIGGSISEGAGAKPASYKSYAYLAFDVFRKRFGFGEGDNIHFVKAGLGGTPSELGLVRYDKDVLRDGTVEPDVLIIEFAVNDKGDETKGVCYESLVLKAMEGPGNPAVVLLFAVFMNDWNLEKRLTRVGYHYDLPMVSIKRAVVKQFYWKKPICTKRQYFSDIYHPTNTGHQIMADCLDYLWEQMDRAEATATDVDLTKPPIIGNKFKNIHTITRDCVNQCMAVTFYHEGAFSDCDTSTQGLMKDTEVTVVPEFPNNWMHTASLGTESFRITIRCSNLMMVYKDTNDVAFGEVLVYVNGIKKRMINPLKLGWNHVNAVLIYQGDEVKEQVVEVRLKQQDGSKNFTILGFGYTDDR